MTIATAQERGDRSTPAHGVTFGEALRVWARVALLSFANERRSRPNEFSGEPPPSKGRNGFAKAEFSFLKSNLVASLAFGAHLSSDRRCRCEDYSRLRR
jgi:hypothetical protein